MERPSDREYKARLGAILRQRDPAALHLFLRQSAAGYGDDRQVSEVEEQSHDEMEELMHRMILARGDLADLHPESRAWLAARDPLGARRRRRRPNRPRLGRSNGR
jgi:hypothetical protein